jgi:energy-coupling factor transporter transmembrane protein EcfT
MAELTSFGYVSGGSFLHRADARIKILCTILLSFVALNVHFDGLGMLTAILLCVILRARLPVVSGFKELRYFSILLLLVFIARVLSAGGPPVFDSMFLPVSLGGLLDAALVCWRLAFIVVLGFAFISTTLPSAIKAAVQWYLKPVPFVPEKKVGVMMGLILRFIPVILDQARQTAEAQKARCVENRKNPVYRLTKFGFPLLRRTFERADDLVVALEARAFTENRTDPELNANHSDWIFLIFVCCLCVALILAG